MSRLETLHMDGLFSDEDIENRYYVIRQCIDCMAFTKWDIRNKNTYACATCGSGKFDSNRQHSIRTHHNFIGKKGRKKVK